MWRELKEASQSHMTLFARRQEGGGSRYCKEGLNLLSELRHQ